MNEVLGLLYDNLETNLLVLARVIGIFAFNPILTRRNIPNIAKVGASLLITLIIVMTVPFESVSADVRIGVYLFMLLKEGIIGCIFGFITDMFFYSVQMSGEIMDMQAGLGMAKVFDPDSHMQMSIMGSYVSFMLYLYFFVTNSHLTYIKLFAQSFEIIPLGTGGISGEFGLEVLKYFAVVLTLVLKLAMPIVVSQIILQFCVGVLMKSVPQIQIMVVNIQLKVGFGFLILYLVAVPMSQFIDRFLGVWIQTIEDAMPLISS